MTDYKSGDPALLRVEIRRPPDDKGWTVVRFRQPGGLGPSIMFAATADILPISALTAADSGEAGGG